MNSGEEYPQLQVLHAQKAGVKKNRCCECAQAYSFLPDLPNRYQMWRHRAFEALRLQIPMQAGTTRVGSLLAHYQLTYCLRSIEHSGLRHLDDSSSKKFHSELFCRNGFCACTSFPSHSSPEELITKERHDDTRFPSRHRCCCCSCSAVVDDGRDTTEEPVVWYVSNKEDITWKLLRAETAPAFGYQCSHAGQFYGVEHRLGQGFWIANDNGAKPYIYGHRPS